jgi:hypothetical protein
MIHQWWTFGLGITGILLFLLFLIVLALVIDTILLKIALGLVNAKHTDFGEVFITALINALIGWIPCLGCILSLIVINSRHDTGFGTAIVVWLLAVIIGFVIAFVIVIFVILPILGFVFVFPWT